MVDITPALQAKSDQLNAEDLITGPITVHVTGGYLAEGNRLVVELAEYPQRPWLASRGMAKFIGAIWGTETDEWAKNAAITLFRNPEVVYGGKAVGGIQIQAISGISKPYTGPLRKSRDKSVPFTIQPLIDHVAESLTDAQIAAAESVEELRAMWSRASTVQQEQITARANQLTGEVSE